MSEGESYPWRRAGRFTLAAFIVLLFLPVWPAWYFGSCVMTGKFVSFWMMLDSLPRAIERCSASLLILDYYGPGLVLPIALLSVSLFGRRWLPGWISHIVRPMPHLVYRALPRPNPHLAVCLFLLATLLVVVFGK